MGALSILLYTLFAPRGRTNLATGDNQADEGRAEPRNGARHAAPAVNGQAARAKAAARARATAGADGEAGASLKQPDVSTAAPVNGGRGSMASPVSTSAVTAITSSAPTASVAPNGAASMDDTNATRPIRLDPGTPLAEATPPMGLRLLRAPKT